MKTKFANLKSTIVKLMLAGTAAGALILASPATAQAQAFAVGVQVGGPYYARRDAFEFERRQEFLRREEFARREAFLSHQEWLRAQRFHSAHGYR